MISKKRKTEFPPTQQTNTEEGDVGVTCWYPTKQWTVTMVFVYTERSTLHDIEWQWYDHSIYNTKQLIPTDNTSTHIHFSNETLQQYKGNFTGIILLNILHKRTWFT